MEKTTPSDSPFHGERDGHKKASQCNNAAYSPPVQGGVGGGSCFFILNSKLYILHLYYLFLAIKIPPMMQVNSRTLITSKGSRYWYFSVPIKAVPMTFWLISPPTKREGPNECINVM